MRCLAFISCLFFLPIFSTAKENPESIKVYCFSEDLEAGFQDKITSYWCNELGKRGTKKKSLTLVENKETADIRIQYLGTEEIRTQGETTYLLGGYAWTPEQFEKGARAIVNVADYSKGFHATGINFQGPGQVLRDIEKWIRENREVILQKANKK